MILRTPLTPLLAATVALVLVVLLFAVGCSSDDEPNGESTTERANNIDGLGEELAEGLPEEIAGFAGWEKLNFEPIPPKSSDPHLGVKDVFYNGTSREAEAVDNGEAPYPEGSLIVKTATRPDADFVGLIAIMRKIKGIDREHNDWEFVEYTRETPDQSFEVIARDAVCWTCHMDAEPTDFVYTRRG